MFQFFTPHPNQTHMKKQGGGSRLALVTGLLMMMAPIAHGQEDEVGETEEIFELSPFRVDTSRDVRYLSTNSTSGTGLNTEIKQLPMSLSVVNQELISDLGATDMAEALEYQAGVFTTDQSASTSVGATRSTGSDDKSISSAGDGERFANVVYIRGLSVPFQNRMGFRYGGIVVTQDSAIALGGLLDASNMERMEVVKGPNSLLYGVGVLTGIVNVIPEMPLSEPNYEATVKVGSDDFFRVTAEATGPIAREGESFIPGQLNYRVAGAHETREHYTDFRNKEVNYYALQLEHRYKDKTRLFLEFQDGNTREEGIGSRWIYDEVNEANDTEFRNEWDEGYNWARHEGGIPRLRPIQPGSYNPSVPTTAGTQAGFLLMDESFVGGGLPDETYRISGPDTFAERDEWNFIADLEVYPLEGLTLNTGVFLSEQETRELELDTGSFTSSNPNVLRRDTIAFDRQLNAIWNAGGVYSVPMQDILEQVAGVDIGPAEGENPNWVFPGLNDDIKLTEYFWERSLVKSDSTQFRAKATYELETDWFFDTSAIHKFLVGYHYINDVVDFPDGSVDPGNARARPAGLNETDPEDRETFTQLNSNDGLYYRSIHNFAPFYFDGRNDGVDGHNTVRAGDVYLNQDITQEGFYGVYHGKFFNDKLDLILGVRRDIYNADQFTYKRVDISDEELVARADAAVVQQAARETASRFGVDPDDVAEGNVPEEALAFRDDLISQRTANGQYVANYYEENIESGDSGAAYFGANRAGPVDQFLGKVPFSQRQIFEQDIEADTLTVGLNYEINEELYVYGVFSQGISPNTALRNGDGDIIPAEETNNREIGLKFDFFDGRLSGSLAFYEIERENAIWDIDWAPAAAKWFDAQLEANRSREWDIPTFDPTLGEDYFIRGEYVTEYLSNVIGVDPSQIQFAGVGNTITQSLDRDSIPDDIAPTLRDKLVLIKEVGDRTKFPEEMIAGLEQTQQLGGNVSINNVGLNAEGLDNLYEVELYNPETGEFVTAQISSAAMLYNAFMEREIDKTKNDFLDNVHPIRYRNFDGFQPQDNNTVNLANAQGSLVTFDETINGIELETIWTVNENLQLVFSYSHVEREADDTFNFTPWRSIATGDAPFVAPFTMLHREYGWTQAGMQLAWVDYDAYAEIASSGEPVTEEQLSGAIIERVENPDETIPTEEIADRNTQGQKLLWIDKRGQVINEANPSRSGDYDQVLSGVSLNFNPEDEAALWSKYTFTEGPLDDLSLNLGIKYIGEARTSVAFRSASPLNPLTVTPEVEAYFKVDFGMSYNWQWNNLDMKLSLNVYNVFDNTYEVNTTVLGIPNPITGEPVTKRTESFRAPRTYRIGLAVRF